MRKEGSGLSHPTCCLSLGSPCFRQRGDHLRSCRWGRSRLSGCDPAAWDQASGGRTSPPRCVKMLSLKEKVAQASEGQPRRSLSPYLPSPRLPATLGATVPPPCSEQLRLYLRGRSEELAQTSFPTFALFGTSLWSLVGAWSPAASREWWCGPHPAIRWQH